MEFNTDKQSLNEEKNNLIHDISENVKERAKLDLPYRVLKRLLISSNVINITNMERKIKEKNPSVLPLLKIIIKELLASNEYVHSDKDTLTRVKEDEEQKIYQNFSSEDLREFYPEVSQLIVNKVIDDVLVKSDSWESERLRFREVSVTKKMRNKLIELKKQNDEKLQKDIMNLIESDTDVKNTPPEEKEVFLLFLGEGLIGLEDLK